MCSSDLLNMATIDPIDIGRDLDDAVAIMSGQVGADAMACDDFGFLRRRARSSQQACRNLRQSISWYGRNRSHPLYMLQILADTT